MWDYHDFMAMLVYNVKVQTQFCMEFIPHFVIYTELVKEKLDQIETGQAYCARCVINKCIYKNTFLDQRLRGNLTVG